MFQGLRKNRCHEYLRELLNRPIQSMGSQTYELKNIYENVHSELTCDPLRIGYPTKLSQFLKNAFPGARRVKSKFPFNSTMKI